MFKEKQVNKLTERYIKPYIVEKVVSKNAVKLKLPFSMRIHSVVNFSKVVKYRKLVKRQKMEELKPVEVGGVKK